jgi:hypothetical protein
LVIVLTLLCKLMTKWMLQLLGLGMKAMTFTTERNILSKKFAIKTYWTHSLNYPVPVIVFNIQHFQIWIIYFLENRTWKDNAFKITGRYKSINMPQSEEFSQDKDSEFNQIWVLISWIGLGFWILLCNVLQ